MLKFTDSSKLFDVLQQAINSALNHEFPNSNFGEFEIITFSQLWGNTGKMFKEFLVGSAITRAYTIVIIHYNEAAVYCDGKLAYVVDANNPNFVEDLKHRSLVNQYDLARYD